MTSFKIGLLAHAEKSNAAKSSGAANTSQWAAKATRTNGAAAHRELKLATGLDGASATRKAFIKGSIHAPHAEIIVGVTKQLPGDLTQVERDRVEADLIAKAQTSSPEELRKKARRALEAIEASKKDVDAHEDAQVLSEEERARAKTKLWLRDNHDGTVTGNFTVPVFHGHLLRKIIHSMTAPRRQHEGNDHKPKAGAVAGSGAIEAGGSAAGANSSRIGGGTDSRIAAVSKQAENADWAKASGNALCDLIEHLPTDHITGRSAATLIVTVDHEVLREKLAVAGLESGETISAAKARQLACTAGIVPAVLGGQSQVLDLGREKRLFTETHRKALAVNHTTCAAEDCDRPFAWSELHHLTAWEDGGPTDLANAIPLCNFHHHRIHDHRYRNQKLASGKVRFSWRQ